MYKQLYYGLHVKYKTPPFRAGHCLVASPGKDPGAGSSAGSFPAPGFLYRLVMAVPE